jgi:hypothetical protein
MINPLLTSHTTTVEPYGRLAANIFASSSTRRSSTSLTQAGGESLSSCYAWPFASLSLGPEAFHSAINPYTQSERQVTMPETDHGSMFPSSNILPRRSLICTPSQAGYNNLMQAESLHRLSYPVLTIDAAILDAPF